MQTASRAGSAAHSRLRGREAFVPGQRAWERASVLIRALRHCWTPLSWGHESAVDSRRAA